MSTAHRPAERVGPVDLPKFSGDHSVPASAPELAASAADSVRLLNHATLIVDVTGGPESWPGYRTPADVADTVASLTRTARMLSQTFSQADRWLGAALATGRIGDDGRRRPAQIPSSTPAAVVADAVTNLRLCWAVAQLLASKLDLAHAALNHLTYDLDDPDDEDDIDRDIDRDEDDNTDGGL